MTFERERRRSSARRDAELGEDVLEMAGNGVLADDEGSGDLPVRAAGRHQAENLELARAEPIGIVEPLQ